MSDHQNEQIELDGVKYSISTKARPDGSFGVYWNCFTCRQGETWGPLYTSREEAKQIAHTKMMTHHAERHGSSSPTDRPHGREDGPMSEDPVKQRLRFSLRKMFVVVTALSVYLGVIAFGLSQQSLSSLSAAPSGDQY